MARLFEITRILQLPLPSSLGHSLQLRALQSNRCHGRSTHIASADATYPGTGDGWVEHPLCEDSRDVEVSTNGGTPKSSILMWCSIVNHIFWGTPMTMETPTCAFSFAIWICILAASNVWRLWWCHRMWHHGVALCTKTHSWNILECLPSSWPESGTYYIILFFEKKIWEDLQSVCSWCTTVRLSDIMFCHGFWATWDAHKLRKVFNILDCCRKGFSSLFQDFPPILATHPVQSHS